MAKRKKHSKAQKRKGATARPKSRKVSKSARGKVTKRTVTRAKSKRAPVKKAAHRMKQPVAPTVETVEHPAPEFEEVKRARVRTNRKNVSDGPTD
jgi:hypothetical protein